MSDQTHIFAPTAWLALMARVTPVHAVMHILTTLPLCHTVFTMWSSSVDSIVQQHSQRGLAMFTVWSSRVYNEVQQLLQCGPAVY